MPRFTPKRTLATRWFSALAAAALLLLPASRAAAQIGSDRYASLVMDAGTGAILSAANADEARYPASLTKMMTLYMLFEALRDRRVSLDQQVPVSAWAASMSPTKLGLLPGSVITVEQAILGLVTKSANDAAAALGEMLGGDEERFAQMMTLRARALGMTRTTFRNASGLPDFDQVTTARDMAVLARRLVQDFPAQYRYFSAPSFVFRGRLILNHQHMLQTYPGADGLKTGYIRDSGYNLVTSALRGSTRLIGVVLGASNGGERDAHMAALLDAGFDGTIGGTGGMVTAMRRDLAPGFRLPGLIGTAQAASAYQPPPLYSAPYSDTPTQRYQAAVAAVPFAASPIQRYQAAAVVVPFAAAPPPVRVYTVQPIEARGRAQPVRARAEPAWRDAGRDMQRDMGRDVARASMRDMGRDAFREPPLRGPAPRRMMERPDPRDRLDARGRMDPRTDRLRLRPTLAAPAQAQPVPARGYDTLRRDSRQARASWQGGRYPG